MWKKTLKAFYRELYFPYFSWYVHRSRSITKNINIQLLLILFLSEFQLSFPPLWRHSLVQSKSFHSAGFSGQSCN